MTAERRIPLLLISGPVGVGKTTVGEEVNAILVQRGTAHTLIDLDVLAERYPRPPDDRFNKRLALANLRDVWANCAAAGSRNLIIPRVIETQQDIADIQSAVPGSVPTVCQLQACDETLIGRVASREKGSGRAWHEARSLELAKSMRNNAPADLVIDTDSHSLIEIAEMLVARVAWVTDA